MTAGIWPAMRARRAKPLPNSVRTSAASFCSDMDISWCFRCFTARAEVWSDLQRRAARRRPYQKGGSDPVDNGDQQPGFPCTRASRCSPSPRYRDKSYQRRDRLLKTGTLLAALVELAESRGFGFRHAQPAELLSQQVSGVE